tara:strand:+ start:112 stop:300 length:189 start_codon:yes stop_codon:yes gene_type:complete
MSLTKIDRLIDTKKIIKNKKILSFKKYIILFFKHSKIIKKLNIKTIRSGIKGPVINANGIKQ